MATLSYAQLEGLWIAGGGSALTAPIAAAIAMAESSGSTTVTSSNPDGGTNVGPWQLDTKGVGSGYSVAQLQDPITNARVAVKGSGNGTDWRDWATYASGVYQRFLNSSVSPAKWTGSTTGPSVAAPPASTNPPSTTTTPVDPTGPLSAAAGFLHDVAVPIAWFVELWTPGQAWRLAFGAGSIASAVGGVRMWRSAGEGEDGSALPLAVLLLGVAAVAAFLALRPWPLSSTGKALTPAYVAVETLHGAPPAAGVAPSPPVAAVEAGLVTITGLWAASKLASGISSAAVGAAAGASLWSKISGWLGSSAEDVGSAVEGA